MEKLGQIFCDYGPIPRLLLEEFNPTATDAGWEEALLAYESGLDCKIVELLRSDPYVLFSERHAHDDSHSVVLLRPDPAQMKGGYCVSRHQVRSIISAYIGRKIGFLSVGGYSQQAWQMYNFLLGTALTKSSAGWIFEGRVHACLRLGGTFKIRSLETSHDVLHFGIKMGEKTFGGLKSLGELCGDRKGSHKVKEEIFNRYLRPEKCNLASIDSLCISKATAESDIARVFLFQITVGAEHAVKASGLREVFESLPARARERTPCIVFVVPEGANVFKKQAVTPVNETPPEAAWEQYVLSISDAQLWSLPEGTEKKRSFSDPNSALKLPKRTVTADQVNRSKEEVEPMGSGEI